MFFCIRTLNFLVLIALGILIAPPVWKFNRSLDAQLPEYFPHPQSAFLLSGWQDRYESIVMPKLGGVKAQIRADLCRRGGFVFLPPPACGSKAGT